MTVVGIVYSETKKQTANLTRGCPRHVLRVTVIYITSDDALRASDGLGNTADTPERHSPPNPVGVTQTVADGFPFRVAATVSTRLVHVLLVTAFLNNSLLPTDSD